MHTGERFNQQLRYFNIYFTIFATQARHVVLSVVSTYWFLITLIYVQTAFISWRQTSLSASLIFSSLTSLPSKTTHIVARLSVALAQPTPEHILKCPSLNDIIESVISIFWQSMFPGSSLFVPSVNSKRVKQGHGQMLRKLTDERKMIR